MEGEGRKGRTGRSRRVAILLTGAAERVSPVRFSLELTRGQGGSIVRE